MKKVFLSILTLIYMTVSSGMAMEIHFCMGERTGFGLYSTSEDTCARCGMKETKGGCCSDEQKFIKLSEDHKNSTAYYVDPVLYVLPDLSEYYYNHKLSPVYKATFRSQAFADSGPPLYLSNCVFRI